MIGHLVIAAALVATLSPAVAGAANDAPTGLPVFPGAVPITHSAPRTIQMCGHAMKTVGYQTAVPMSTVVAWYRSALGGAAPLTHVVKSDDSIISFSSFPTVGNAKIVNVQQTSYTGSAAKYVSAADKKVLIGLSTVDPPLSAAEIVNPKHDCG